MDLAKLNLCPEWPAVMDMELATLYLGGRPRILEALINGGYLRFLTNRHRSKLVLKVRLDEALIKAEANDDPLVVDLAQARAEREASKEQKAALSELLEKCRQGDTEGLAELAKKVEG